METQKTVDIIRRMRHDFGNHLQVISGYIELQRYSDVKKYINSIIEEMADQRRIFETSSAKIALYLFEQILMARDLGIILRYKELDIHKPAVLIDNNEPFNSLVELTRHLEVINEEPVVYLSLYQNDNGVRMVFNGEVLQENPTTISIKE